MNYTIVVGKNPSVLLCLVGCEEAFQLGVFLLVCLRDSVCKARIVDELLVQAYGSAVWSPRLSLMDELVYTILSQNTTSANCQKAFDALKLRFPDWDDVLGAGPGELEDAIKPAGLWRSKAFSIRCALQELGRTTEKPHLDWLAELSDEDAISSLMSIPGVGRKTAACVLMFGMGRPVLAVDTHVRRVSIQLGLIPKTTLDKAHDLLAEVVAPESVYEFHVNMVRHGREVCHARNPACAACVLSSECDFYVRKSQAYR